MPNELVTIENPEIVFLGKGSAIAEIIAEVRMIAKNEVFNVETQIGRDNCRSMAYSIARSKTYLDELGKDLVTDWKDKAKAVDANRKVLRDSLDALKEEVRAPLTDWEDKKKAENEMRLLAIWQTMALGVTSDDSGVSYPIEEIERRIKALYEMPEIDPEWFGEHTEAAVHSFMTADLRLTERRDVLLKERDEEALRVKDEDEKRSREIEDRVKREQTEALEAERKEHAEALQRAEIAKEEAIEEERNRAAADAVRVEEMRIKSERDKAEKVRIEQERRESRQRDELHREVVRDEAIRSMVTVAAVSVPVAASVVDAIIAESIDHIAIIF